MNIETGVLGCGTVYWQRNLTPLLG